MEETKVEEVDLEHGMFALERQEDLVAIIISVLMVVIVLF